MRKISNRKTERATEKKPKLLNAESNWKSESNHPFTLITGASAGIGQALAVESAKKHKNLILTALPGENLGELSKRLADEYGITVKYLEIDLTEKNAPQQVYDWCVQKRLPVNRLINNAGIMNRGAFEDHSPQFYENMMNLNMNAVVLLTRLFLPELKKHKSSSILNLGSLASFLPIPYKAVYAATKAFIYSFSIGLKEELRGSCVKVHLLCPGSVPTNQEIKSRIARDGWFSKMSVLHPEKVAKIALRKMEMQAKIIFPGIVNRIYMTLGNFLPKSLRLKVMARVFRKNHALSTKEEIPFSNGLLASHSNNRGEI
jgi:short-subunit dehydrogenase